MIKIEGDLVVIPQPTEPGETIAARATIGIEEPELLEQLTKQGAKLFGHTIKELKEIVRVFDYPAL